MLTLSARFKNFFLTGCQKGNAALEFAVVLPVTLLLMLGLMEFGTVLYLQNVLEGSTSMGARAGLSGFAPGGQSREQYIRDTITSRSGGILDANRLRINTLAYSSFANIGQPEPCNIAACNSSSPPGTFTDVNGNGVWDADQGLPTAGGPNSVVLYTVEYDWSILTPLIGQYLGTGGLFTLRSVATVQNEPF